MHYMTCCIVCVHELCPSRTHDTTHSVCMIYGLRQQCTVLLAYLPCLLLKRDSYVCLFCLDFSITANFISQLPKQMLTNTKVSQIFVTKTSLNKQLVRAFRRQWKVNTQGNRLLFCYRCISRHKLENNIKMEL
jgi:hypothetical protein